MLQTKDCNIPSSDWKNRICNTEIFCLSWSFFTKKLVLDIPHVVTQWDFAVSNILEWTWNYNALVLYSAVWSFTNNFQSIKHWLIITYKFNITTCGKIIDDIYTRKFCITYKVQWNKSHIVIFFSLIIFSHIYDYPTTRYNIINPQVQDSKLSCVYPKSQFAFSNLFLPCSTLLISNPSLATNDISYSPQRNHSISVGGNYIIIIICQILTAMSMKMTVFRDVVQYNLIDTNQHFRWPFCLYISLSILLLMKYI